MNFVASEDQRFKVELNSGQFISAFPAKVVRIPVDKEAVLAQWYRCGKRCGFDRALY